MTVISTFITDCDSLIAVIKAQEVISWSTILRAMVLDNAERWFADDGKLSKTFCEQTDKDIKFDENDCCACEEAKYSVSHAEKSPNQL